MVDFIEAVDTINDPEGNYYYLEITDDSFNFIEGETSTPIEAGTFYTYYRNQYTDVHIVIDNVALSFTENPTPTSHEKYTFSKSFFDLGSLYSSVSTTSFSSQDVQTEPILYYTIKKNDMILNQEEISSGAFLRLGPFAKDMMFAFIGGGVPINYYYNPEITIKPREYSCFFSDNVYFSMNAWLQIQKVVNYTESNQ